jgi:collagenase-like PrtC family protease
MAPDALIMSDPGLIMLVRRHYRQMSIHLSVQANIVNGASVEFWQQQGLKVYLPIPDAVDLSFGLLMHAIKAT